MKSNYKIIILALVASMSAFLYGARGGGRGAGVGGAATGGSAMGRSASMASPAIGRGASLGGGSMNMARPSFAAPSIGRASLAPSRGFSPSSAAAIRTSAPVMSGNSAGFAMPAIPRSVGRLTTTPSTIPAGKMAVTPSNSISTPRASESTAIRPSVTANQVRPQISTPVRPSISKTVPTATQATQTANQADLKDKVATTQTASSAQTQKTMKGVRQLDKGAAQKTVAGAPVQQAAKIEKASQAAGLNKKAAANKEQLVQQQNKAVKNISQQVKPINKQFAKQMVGKHNWHKWHKGPKNWHSGWWGNSWWPHHGGWNWGWNWLWNKGVWWYGGYPWWWWYYYQPEYFTQVVYPVYVAYYQDASGAQIYNYWDITNQTGNAIVVSAADGDQNIEIANGQTVRVFHAPDNTQFSVQTATGHKQYNTATPKVVIQSNVGIAPAA